MAGVLLEAGTAYHSHAHSWIYPLFLIGFWLLIILVFCPVFYLCLHPVSCVFIVASVSELSSSCVLCVYFVCLHPVSCVFILLSSSGLSSCCVLCAHCVSVSGLSSSCVLCAHCCQCLCLSSSCVLCAHCLFCLSSSCVLCTHCLCLFVFILCLVCPFCCLHPVS